MVLRHSHAACGDAAGGGALGPADWRAMEASGKRAKRPGGPVALVTGASGGIGRVVALALAVRGAHVLVAARRQDACRAVVEEIERAGGSAEALSLDVADPDVAERVRGLRVDWLVNNAGIAESAPLGRTDEELVARHMEVNFHGPRRIAQVLLAGMRERKAGRIVNVASSAGLRGYAYVAAYCASKFALVGWTLASAAELRGSGVTCNAVCPHYVDSPMLEAAVANLVVKAGKKEAEARAFFAAQNPGGRLVAPEEVAAAVVELVGGDENGCLLELDGERVVRRRPNEDAPATAGGKS